MGPVICSHQYPAGQPLAPEPAWLCAVEEAVVTRTLAEGGLRQGWQVQRGAGILFNHGAPLNQAPQFPAPEYAE